MPGFYLCRRPIHTHAIAASQNGGKLIAINAQTAASISHIVILILTAVLSHFSQNPLFSSVAVPRVRPQILHFVYIRRASFFLLSSNFKNIKTGSQRRKLVGGSSLAVILWSEYPSQAVSIAHRANENLALERNTPVLIR